jgi:hypothetical protein
MKTAINRNNYEAWFLDYHEHQLSPQQLGELRNFLLLNPDLKEEFDEFEMITLRPDDSLKFTDKSSLKKPSLIPVGQVTEENYETHLVAYLEGDLDGESSEDVDLFLKANPSIAKEYRAYEAARIFPDLTIRYPGKESLKRSPVLHAFSRAMYYPMAAAASLALLLGLYFNQSHQGHSILTLRRAVEVSGTSAAATPSNERYIRPALSVHLPESGPVQAQGAGEGEVRITAVTRLPVTQPGSDLLSAVQVDSRVGRIAERYDWYVTMQDLIIAAERYQNIGTESKTLVGTLLARLTRWAVRDIEKPGILTPQNMIHPSFWAYAVNGYNRLTDNNVRWEHDINRDNKTVSYGLTSDRVEFTRVKKIY